MRDPGTRRTLSGLLAGLMLASTLIGASGSSAAAAPSESGTPPTWVTPVSASRGRLAGVSCVSATRCIAVGSIYISALVETWNGANWTVTPSPNAGSSNSLAAVSCGSATSCVAAGESFGAGEARSLIEMWNGTRWSAAPLPRVTGGAGLTGVSCSSATRCVAVGVVFNEGPEQPIAYVWNGKRWSIPPLPDLPLGWAGRLSGVSCASANDCVAVGDATPPDVATQTLVETWNGTRWSVTPSPTHGNFAGRGFTAVSCSAETSCFAVGFAGGSPLVEAWDGTHWFVVHSPGYPGKFFDSELLGVSCASPTSCVAAGNGTMFVDHGTDISRTLLERWDGMTWSVTPSPAGSGAQDVNSLAGVSCTSDHCAAVGYFDGARFEANTLVLSGDVPRRSVSVSWTAEENARLIQIAAYLHVPPAAAQKTAVYVIAYLLGFQSRAPTPVKLAAMGSAATYTSVWSPSELGVLDSVRAKYVLSSVGATRLSVHLYSYLLALGGH